MARIHLPTFGGMIPALSDRLIPDTGAAYAQNCWLYEGTLKGLPVPKLIHTLVLSSAQKIYRVPLNISDASDMYSATFLEFEDPNTDVVRSPVFEDTFERYYWVSSGVSPKYNTKARIEFSSNEQSEDITADDSTDLIAWTAHGLVVGDPLQFTTTDTLPAGLSLATTYYVSSDGLVADAFKVADTYIDAVEGNSVDITDTGTGTHTATTQEQAEFTLGIPQPAAPTVVPSGGSGSADTRSYVVTWVSAYGEEGPPSDADVETGKVDDTWAITLPTPSANDLGVTRNLRYVRIYRTVVSGSGVATFYLVAEVDIWDTSYNDTDADAVVAANSALASTGYTAPPTDLEGFVHMGNGILVGFKDNEIWFTEPYRPHAWPVAYVLTTEYPIIGVGVANQTAIICTQGSPVSVTGVNPLYMAVAKFTALEPCISRGSILSTTEGVYYASSNGLILVQSGSVQNITRQLVTRDKWQRLINNSAVKAARFGLAYYAFGASVAGAFEETAFEETAFSFSDTTNSFMGVLVDPTDARVAFTRLVSDDSVDGVMTDPWTGEVMIIRDGEVLWIDLSDDLDVLEECVWKSKVFQTNEIMNFAALKVYFTLPPVEPDSYGTIEVYGDGVLRVAHTLETSGKLLRIPSGFKAQLWQIVITTSVVIRSVEMATSVKELQEL